MTGVYSKACVLAVIFLALHIADGLSSNLTDLSYPTQSDSNNTTPTSKGECVCDCHPKKPPKPPRRRPHPPPPPPPPPPPHENDEIPTYDKKYFSLEDDDNSTCFNISMAIIISIVYEMLENSTSIINFVVPEDIMVTGECPTVYDYRNGIVTYRANVTVLWEEGDFSLTLVFLTFFYTDIEPTTPAPIPTTEPPFDNRTDFPTFPPTNVETEPVGLHAEATEQTHTSEQAQGFQGQQYLSNIVFSYYTGSPVFEDPAEPYYWRTIMKNQSYFQTMAGTTYLCNSHKSMTLDDDVTMNIKYATINPFEYVYQRHNVSNSDIPPVFQCAEDFKTDNIGTVIIACSIVGGIAVLVLVAAVIHFATQGTNNHPTVMFKTYAGKSGYTSFQ